MLKSYICNKLGCSLKNELFKPQTSKANFSSMPEWCQEFAGHIPVHRSLSAWMATCGYTSSAYRELEKKVIFHIKCELLCSWVWYQHRVGLCQCLYLVCKAGKYSKPGALESKDLSSQPGLGLLWAASGISLLPEQNEAKWGRNARG